MLTGKLFQLRAPSAVIDFSSGKPVRMELAAGAVLRVVNESDNGSLVDAVYEGRLLYAVRRDVELYGEEIASKKPVRAEEGLCSVCKDLQFRYEQSVGNYSAAVRGLSGAIKDDSTMAFEMSEKSLLACRQANALLTAHVRTHDWWGRHAKAAG